LLREKGYWKRTCGTGKQQENGQCHGEFRVCEAEEKLLREKGHWKRTCGTGIERRERN